jgi:GNAT superfamily N-acetyltransferase
MIDIIYSPLEIEDLYILKDFTDKWIGENYFSINELEEILKKSKIQNLNCSFKATVDNELAGVRLTLAPGTWITDSTRGLSIKDWKVPKEKVAYFKSLFISDKYQKLGIGKKLSNFSIECLKQMETEAIICHSWLESPGNSSQRYLKSFNFQPVKEYKAFWSSIDYECTKCSPTKCSCTAIEMVKYL